MTATAEATDFTVLNTNSTGPGSLDQAMIDQNNGTGPDRVLFQSGLSGSITLTTDLTTVDEPLQVLGPGANVLAINGNNAHRIFNNTARRRPDGLRPDDDERQPAAVRPPGGAI